MSQPTSAARSSRLSFLIRPLSLQGTLEGGLFAVLCALSLVLIYLVDIETRKSVTIGSLAAIPVLASGWLLSRRLTIAITAFAVLLRILAIGQGGIAVETGIAQAFTAPLFAFIGRVAAEHFAKTQNAAARTALVSRIARIATSSDRLNVILYGVLDEMARDGYAGGLIALMDERNELYPAAVEGSVDRRLLEDRLLGVSGFMQRASTEGRSIFVRNVAPPASTGGRTLEYQPRSVVAVPLRGAGTVLGVLELDRPERNTLDDDDCLLFEQVALAISGAVQRAGALQLADEQLRRRLKDLTLLLETARTLSSSLDLEHIQREVVRRSAELIALAGREGVRASLFTIEGNTARFLVEFDERGTRLTNERFPLHQHRGLVKAIETGHCATWDFDVSEEPLATLVRRAGVRSGAFAPVRTGADIYGVLSAASRDNRPFEPEELRLLEGIADLAGLAISNSQRLGLEVSRSQQLREHGERMQALEKTKSEFLRLASHELRGPIAILRGYISMLNEGTLGELPDQTRRVLPMLTEKVAEMNHLIDQMLETARLEDTRLQLHLELIDLTQVLKESLDAVAGKARSGGCNLVTEIRVHSSNGTGASGGSDRVSVLADRERLSTILVNLLDNAIKYSPDGGEVKARLWLDEGEAMVSIADHGLGIDRQDMDRLFTRFGRIVTPENSHIPGTGLGLYLSRELARMHGGDITVSSAKGEGTVFTLSLPVAVERLHRLAAEPVESA